MSKNQKEHLDVYNDHSILYSGSLSMIFREGKQSYDAKNRYDEITQAFENGFYAKAMEDIPAVLIREELTEEQKKLIKSLVDGLTSEVGRAIVGLSCLQLAIKAIVPAQSIRLHKGGQRKRGFSWEEGISMRTLDNTFNTPFLREYGLLNMNKDGIMMTRSLAENYPYSRLYKADIRGPISPWVSIVESIENKTLPPYAALCFLLSLLKNRSDVFSQKVEKLLMSIQNLNELSFQQAKDILIIFYSNTTYSARAFEVVIHGFMQALSELKLVEGVLEPLSQMRSANKKHGNVGDVELKYGNMIIESWDAKYGKPYLRDELEELHDKLSHHPNVEIAGFIANSSVEKSIDIMERTEELSLIHNCEIMLLSFEEWLNIKITGLDNSKLIEIASHWLIAVIDSFGQRRKDIAPIDEPCDEWVEDLLKAFSE